MAPIRSIWSTEHKSLFRLDHCWDSSASGPYSRLCVTELFTGSGGVQSASGGVQNFWGESKVLEKSERETDAVRHNSCFMAFVFSMNLSFLVWSRTPRRASRSCIKGWPFVPTSKRSSGHPSPSTLRRYNCWRPLTNQACCCSSISGYLLGIKRNQLHLKKRSNRFHPTWKRNQLTLLDTLSCQSSCLPRTDKCYYLIGNANTGLCRHTLNNQWLWQIFHCPPTVKQ